MHTPVNLEQTKLFHTHKVGIRIVVKMVTTVVHIDENGGTFRPLYLTPTDRSKIGTNLRTRPFLYRELERLRFQISSSPMIYPLRKTQEGRNYRILFVNFIVGQRDVSFGSMFLLLNLGNDSSDDIGTTTLITDRISITRYL